ncbi:MAG: hypothetical protein JST93_16320 [Acidobacteria bacterium]|nr:hypothetical protein [Acidobacteriota bacterium]
MDPDTKFLLTFGAISGALGSFAERLVFYLAQARSGAGNAAMTALASNAGDVGLQVLLGALVTPVFMILVDINKQNRARVIGTSFALGAVWSQAFQVLVNIAGNIVNAAPN